MAAVLNSLFWIGFGLGRLGGVVVLRLISPKNAILFDVFGTILSLIIISIFGESTAEIIWVFTFIYGFFQATVYPSGVSWASRYTNISGRYIFIFSIGQALGCFVILPVDGYIFGLNPFHIIFVVLGCSICNGIAFCCMMLEETRLENKKKAFC